MWFDPICTALLRRSRNGPSGHLIGNPGMRFDDLKSVGLSAAAGLALFCALCFGGTGLALASDESQTWYNDAFAAARPASQNKIVTVRRTRAQVAARASFGDPTDPQASTTKLPSLSGGGITWQASSGCVPGQLRGVLSGLVQTFGPVTVTSTCRSRGANRAAGGAGHSYHLTGEAVDFRVRGSTGAVYAYLANSGSVGGLKHYGGGLFHIDTGPRRSW